MEQRPVIYTYGNTQINATELVHLMQANGINCVVDCRPMNNSQSVENTPTDKLTAALKLSHIAYLPFFKHFGFFPNEMRNRNGEPVYQKAIQSEHFLQGIDRIHHGVQKGFSICIIDDQRETLKSKRFTLIGKYLKETYRISHISPYGNHFSQEQVEQQIEEQKKIRKKVNKESQEVGQTGEELAALHLMNNGYQILDKNWNLHRGCELDIVAMKDNKIHFIEVKTRSSDRYGEPQIAINYKKRQHLSKAINAYRYKKNLFNTQYQVDSIAIIYRADDDYDLKHFLDIRFNGQACADVITRSARPVPSHSK